MHHEIFEVFNVQSGHWQAVSQSNRSNPCVIGGTRSISTQCVSVDLTPRASDRDIPEQHWTRLDPALDPDTWFVAQFAHMEPFGQFADRNKGDEEFLADQPRPD